MKEITRQWLNSAVDDLDTIKEIVGIEHLSHIVAFHCQQCIEKGLDKSFFIFYWHDK